MRISLSLDVYGLAAIVRSCYWLTDRCFVYLAPPKQGMIEISLISKNGDLTDTNRLTWDFLNDLVDQQLRVRINEETRTIREMIVAQAFADTDLIDDRGRPRQQTPEADQGDNDSEGIQRWRPVS